MPGINQIQVKPQINLTFANALRSIVRQDPDVIMIGEIRDLETAEIAVQSALTGHLVLSTVHTNDAASTMNRLLDMGVEDYLLTSTVIGVLAQRLVRTLCPHCKEPHAALPEIVDQMRLDRFTAEKEITLYRPIGCAQCAQTGYTGRISIMEMLPVTDPLRSLVMKHATRDGPAQRGDRRRDADDVRGRAAQGRSRDHDVRGSAARDARELTERSRARRRSRSRTPPRRSRLMPIFRYKAVNAAGAVATGELDAANESEIVERLRDQGMLPMQVARATGAGTAGASGAARNRRRGERWFASKTRHPRSAAVDHPRARDAAAGRAAARSRARDPDRPRRRRRRPTALLQQIRDDVRGGKSLSQALDTRRDVFSRFYINIVRAGEAGGALGVVLTRLADTMERNKELRESVKSALIYPMHPDRRRRAVGDGAARLGRAAVRADVRAGGQGAAAGDAGRHRRRHGTAPLVVGDGARRRRARLVRPPKARAAGGAPRAWMRACCGCRSSAIS